MADIAKKHSERLDDLKQFVEDSHEYFCENIRRYNEFMQFVFKTSMTMDEVGALQEIGKPTVEFNILEAQISLLRGQFAKQQPNLSVRAADGVPLSMLNRNFIDTMEVIEAHLRAIFFDGANDMLEYNVYSDLLGGGFSVLRVYTDYINEMSFEQNICVERVFDPTLCGFDPLARDSHKGDGRWCFELYPMTKGQFEDEFGEDKARNMKFTRELSGFGWSYKNEDEDIVLVCDFYEKQEKPETILKLSNGHSLTKKQYEEFLAEWERRGTIEVPPIPIKERRTLITKIVRYRFCENQVLDFIETNYKHLPLIFCDGNSVTLNCGQTSEQMTRPYVYHAKGIQRLKNFAGQSLANELENTIQHKFIVAIEAIPVEYQNAYQNVQKADTLIYNHFLDVNKPDITLPAPREIQRTPIPPEIAQTFRMADEMTQTILGSIDNAQGLASGQLSGVAYARSAIQSNNASMPYVVGYIKALNRVAQIIVDLIPKYYRTPRSMPVLLPNGKREYIEINKQGSLYMDYDPTSLQVKVEAGVNFAMQKEIALQTVVSLSQSMPAFADFFGKKGLNTLLDNIDIRGIDDLKQKAEEYEKEQAMQAQQQQQVQMQQMQMQGQMQQMSMQQAQKELQAPTQSQIELMALQQKAQVDSATVAIKERDSESKFLEVMGKIRMEGVEAELKAAQIEAEQARTSVDSAIALSKHMNEGANNGQTNSR